MRASISRRDFLNSLVPSWVTKKNLLAGAISVGVVIAVSVIISVLRKVGFLSVLKMSAIGVGLLCILWVFGSITLVLQDVFKKAPPVVQALVFVLFRFSVGVAMCVLGAHVYARWQAAEDKTEFIITSAFFFVAAFFGEWQKQRANKPLHGTPAKVSLFSTEPESRRPRPEENLK